MIKVIEHGKRRQIRCPVCLCLFSYEKEDTKTVQTGVNDHNTYVNCPECGERMRIEYDD